MQLTKNLFDLSDNKYQNILDYFSNLRINSSWSFAEYKQSQTTKLSHSYHRYAAKFIPQLCEKLFETIIPPNRDPKSFTINDPFMGSGTTIISALTKGYKVIGSDINEIAFLISKVKATPIEPNYLRDNINILKKEVEKLTKIIIQLKEGKNISSKDYDINSLIPQRHKERIFYWFTEENVQKLALLLKTIRNFRDERIINFFTISFSHILKNTSIWLQNSTKPTRDKNKKQRDPFKEIFRHLNKMEKGNKEYYRVIPEYIKESLENYLHISVNDAREQKIESKTVDLILTSSPYITSYEYADIHQLSSIWLDLVPDLKEYRKSFIGTAYKAENDYQKKKLRSKIAEDIVSKMAEKSTKVAKEIKHYFIDMYEVLEESFRILKDDGKVSYIIGNTTLKGVNIYNAEVFTELMIKIGFKIDEIIKREIPSKILPQNRDSKTGKFAKVSKADKVAYPHEFIIIASKSSEN